MTEGCLSIPNVRIKLTCRAAEVFVEGVNQFNEPIKVELAEVEAVAFRHELDHLIGKTILDIIIDENVIGGAIFEYKGKISDQTLKNKLHDELVGLVEKSDVNTPT